MAAVDVHGIEDDPHAAPPELADEPVVAEPLGGRRREARRGIAATGVGARAHRARCRLQEHAPHRRGELRNLRDVIVGPRLFALPAPAVDLVVEQVPQQRLSAVVGDPAEEGGDVGPPRRSPLVREGLAQQDDLLEGTGCRGVRRVVRWCG